MQKVFASGGGKCCSFSAIVVKTKLQTGSFYSPFNWLNYDFLAITLFAFVRGQSEQTSKVRILSNKTDIGVILRFLVFYMKLYIVFSIE